MTEEREVVTLGALTRWLVIAAIVLAGLGLYFALGLHRPPVVSSSLTETGR